MPPIHVLEECLVKNGCTDFRWLSASDIVVANWVRMKCLYGCASLGKSLSCPPHTPSIAECRAFFAEYEDAVVFLFATAVDKPEQRRPWSETINEQLLQVEKDVFLKGYHKVFMLLLNECRRCDTCSGNMLNCAHPETLRPLPESMGVDLFETVRRVGFPIGVLGSYTDVMDRYALLLVR